MTESIQTHTSYLGGSPRNEKLVVASLAMLALVLRLVYVFGMRASPYFDAPIMDSAYHVDWARAIATGHEFRPGPFFRAPLYPWFLALTQWLFGNSLLAPRLIQCFFGVATTVLCFAVGKRAFDARTGALAAFGAATYWVFLYFDAELLIATLIVPLDLAALYVTLGLARHARPRTAALAGCLWGVSAIARPNVLLLMPLLVLWLLWQARPAWRRALLPAAAFTAGVVAPILPITTYNIAVGGDTVLISSQAGVNFWIGNNPQSDGSSAVVPGTRLGWWEGFYDSIAQAEAAEGRELRPSEVSAHYSRKAWSWISEHPADAWDHLAWKTRLLFTNWELGNNLVVTFFAERFNPFVRWLPVRLPLIIGLGCLGLVLVLRRGSVTFPLWGFALVYSLSIVAFFVCSRFRVPVMAPWMILAAYGLRWLLSALRQRRTGALCTGLVFASLVGLGTTRIPTAVRTAQDNGYLQLGDAEVLAGRPAQAIPHYQKALRINPANTVASVGLAVSLTRTGQNEKAEQVLQDARRTAPWMPELIDELLNLLMDAGRLGEATQLVEEARAHDPGMPRLSYHLGRIHFGQGRFAEAVRSFEIAVAQDPTSFSAHFSLGFVLERSSNPAAAIPYYQRAVELVDRAKGPFGALAYANLIRLLKGAHRDREAEAVTRQLGEEKRRRGWR